MQGQGRGAGDFWSGLALAALGGYIVLQARQWEYLGPDGPGAGFFPYWYGIALVALALALAAAGLRRGAFARTDVAWRRVGRALATWVAFVLAIASFKLIGFVLGFALFTFFVVAVLYRRPAGIAAAVALGTSAAFYLLFALALGVPLPAGPLGF